MDMRCLKGIRLGDVNKDAVAILVGTTEDLWFCIQRPKHR